MKKASLLQVARLGGGRPFIGNVNNYGTMININGGATFTLPNGVVIGPGGFGVFSR